MTRPLALVFGGSRGIGAASVEALARGGHDVAFTYVSQATEGPQVPGATTRGYACDIRDAAAVAAVCEQVTRDFGRPLHCVVANAGINVPPAPVAQIDDEVLRRVVDVNLIGAVNVLREAARRVEDGGVILALTTSMVRTAPPAAAAYTSTKAAVEIFIRAMAKELAPRRVRVNAVAPGPVDTELFHAGKTEEVKARAAALSPFNRIGTPEEVAAVVAFLASDAASWMHGQIVQPNGGMA
ncbi:MAG: SDR family oxidoreductase [Burkholderiaceae bacterium]|jgi:3-oxoacyl-[acyl-carrier protein] reductase|nr:SDR family oxidoreductase [Burkholderiaceae bacterium]